MITTFHIALFLAYHVWENYVAPLFRSDENVSTTDGNGNLDSSSSVSATVAENTVVTVTDERNNTQSNLTSRNELVMNKPENTKQAKEGDGDVQSYIQNVPSDEGCKGLGYSFEAKFECFVDPEEGGMRFIPPVYTQRYMVIEHILKEQCWTKSIRKVVDFGCAELTFEVRNLKKMSWIQEIIAVDVDSELLERMYGKVGPTITDHLEPRSSPLTIRVFCGSVAHTNEVLADTDAVIAIELIEHLYPEDLERLPFTVFGFMKPKIAIFTTPNADFNVLFPNFTGFRHDDHKFEWSRKQFQDWGNNLVERYPNYRVVYRGVGPGAAGTEHLGCCSQMAMFIRINHSLSVTDDEIHIQDGPYKLIQEYVYPVFMDTRTREEKISDDANYFITNCRSLSKRYDEEIITEIPLKDIMARVRCYQREKLIHILTKDRWKVTTNADGYEVVLLPESDSEENDSYREEFSDDGSTIDKNYDINNGDVTLNCEENWDFENTVPNVSTSCVDRTEAKCSLTYNLESNDSLKVSDSCLATNCFYIPESSNPDSSTCIDCSYTGDIDSKCSPSETVVPNGDTCSNSASQYLGCSVYETPCSSPCNIMRTEDGQQASDGCNRTSSPEIIKSQSKSKSYSFYSECDETFIYATPCCSHIHKKSIPKSLSLQQINEHYGSPLLSTELDDPSRGHILTGKQKDKSSKSMEAFKSQESCELHETSSNASRVVDSGYPDSYSMDMDLTPEQFDEIEMESKGSDVSPRSLSPPLPLAPVVARIVNNVENGDVVNNNRDGEGNNMVADMEEEPLQFEAQIEEVNLEVPNMAAVLRPDIEYNQLYGKSPSPPRYCTFHDICLTDEPLLWTSTSEKHQTTELSEIENFKVNKIVGSVSDNLSSKHNLKNKRSDLSIATSSTWSHLASVDSQTYFDVHEGVNQIAYKQDPNRLKTCTSLTTVLDGCSRFSNCSLVRPVENRSTCNELTDSENTSKNTFPKWLLSIDYPVFGSRRDKHENVSKENVMFQSFTGLPQQDYLSISSIYQSAASLNSLVSDNNGDHCHFPEWLLQIQLSDEERDELDQVSSVESLWNLDNFEELPPLVYNVQVDSRGGGDPQRDTWN